MKAESTVRLPAIGYSRGRVILRFNFESVVKALDDGKKKTFWQFEYVEAITSDRSDLIDAIIGSRYTKSDELAMINNKDIDVDGSAEYTAYQAFRKKAKAIADEALQNG